MALQKKTKKVLIIVGVIVAVLVAVVMFVPVVKNWVLTQWNNLTKKNSNQKPAGLMV